MSKDFHETFKFCDEQRFSEYSSQILQNLLEEILEDNTNDFSDTKENEYLEYLINKYSIKHPTLKLDKPFSVWETKKLVPAELFPIGSFDVKEGEKYERSVIVYQIPFEGDYEMFKLKPDETNYNYSNYSHTYIDNKHLCFDVINFYNDLQRVKKNAEGIIENIKATYIVLVNKIGEFNHSLKWNAEDQVKNRKSELSSLTEVLGVPIKKVQNVPEVFSSNEKQLVILKPRINDEKQTSQYVLSDEIYLDILQKIHDIGKNFERYPSTHKDKKEEDLRDFIITFLQPLYQLAVTGETFNKGGKADILIRYKNTNVFIAECKFWRGQKEFLKGISQLLGYLTWRDSKASVIIFVKKKDFSSILQTVKDNIINHENYICYIDSREESWLNYNFCLNGDKNQKIKLAIQLFNLEKPE